MFRLFHYIWFIDSENWFHSYFERTSNKVYTLDIAHFPNKRLPIISAAPNSFKI